MRDRRQSENFKRTRPTMASATPLDSDGHLEVLRISLPSSSMYYHLSRGLLLLRANRPVSRLTLSLHIGSNTDAQSNVLIGQESAPKPPPPLKDCTCKPQKSWHKKFCQVFKPSKRGIERLEVFDSEDDTGTNTSLRIITLENCVKITPDAQKHQLNVFTIVTKTSTHHIAALSENEMSEWIRVFQSVAFKDDCSRRTIEEDNDLYCSSGEGVFMVNLVPSEASRRCGLEPGAYTLVVSSAAIQLRDSANHHLHFVWPYRYIRRYGYREGKFTFEAGRKCDTGEGTFHLEHSNQQEIFPLPLL
uniref:Insulin receptor substrate 1 n=1 Tax=Timema douglasi TaxID=61478 RepID=A0A7R8VBI3_TIMDO|nr:unnamed protein product [Timema douglasi]